MPDRLRRAVSGRRLSGSTAKKTWSSRWSAVLTNIVAPAGLLVAYLS